MLPGCIVRVEEDEVFGETKVTDGQLEMGLSVAQVVSCAMCASFAFCLRRLQGIARQQRRDPAGHVQHLHLVRRDAAEVRAVRLH
eukprot:6256795-Amphidinium_carterae.3